MVKDCSSQKNILFLFRLAGDLENFVDDRIHHTQDCEDPSNDRTNFCEEMEEWHVMAIRFDHEGRDIENKEDSWQNCFSELIRKERE